MERTGSLAVGLAVGTALVGAVAAVLLSQSARISLRNVISAEQEEQLVNFAKKKAALLAVTTPSPCSSPVASTTFTAEPAGTADAGLSSRCFTASGPGPSPTPVSILQACKVCQPGQDGYQVVSVQLPACTLRQATFKVTTVGGLLETFCIKDSGCGYSKKNQWVQLSAVGVDGYYFMWQLGFWGYIDGEGKFTAISTWCFNGTCYPFPCTSIWPYTGWIGHSPSITYPPPPN